MKKITTLIPAYKTEYLAELFLSLHHQTYKNFHIIVSDDSPNGKVTEALQSEAFKGLLSTLNLNLIQGPRNGGNNNVMHLVRTFAAQSELLHVLCDDDIIYPRFYEYHVGIHNTPDVACTISRRWTAFVSGLPIGMLPLPSYIEQNMAKAVLLDTEGLFRSTVPFCHNWLGEVSNTIFASEMASIFLQQEMNGISYMGLGDIGFILQASLTKKVIFLQDYLGFFRLSPNQNTSQTASPVRKVSFIGWCALAVAGMQLGRLSREEAYGTFSKINLMIRSDYPDDEEMQRFASLFSSHPQLTDDLIHAFTQMWEDFVRTNRDSL